jgi:membrane protein
VLCQIQADQLPLIAAGVAFYAMLALFPAMIALVSVYALVADPDQVPAQLAPIVSTLPGVAGDLVVDQLRKATQLGRGGLTIGLMLSVLGVMWSVSTGIKALITGVNLVYDEQDSRGPLRLRASALVLTVATLIVAAIALGLIAAFPLVLDRFGPDTLGRSLANVARWVVLTLLIGVALAGLYRYGPDRDRPRWPWVNWGAFVTVVLWLAASAGFSLYVSNFSHYYETYGALAGVAILLLWLYLSSFIALLGAEINSEIEHQTTVDSTVGPAEPMGQGGAVVADTLGRGADNPEGSN